MAIYRWPFRFSPKFSFAVTKILVWHLCIGFFQGKSDKKAKFGKLWGVGGWGPKILGDEVGSQSVEVLRLSTILCFHISSRLHTSDKC